MIFDLDFSNAVIFDLDLLIIAKDKEHQKFHNRTSGFPAQFHQAPNSNSNSPQIVKEDSPPSEPPKLGGSNPQMLQ